MITDVRQKSTWRYSFEPANVRIRGKTEPLPNMR
jgi:hypothetical protein